MSKIENEKLLELTVDVVFILRAGEPVHVDIL